MKKKFNYILIILFIIIGISLIILGFNITNNSKKEDIPKDNKEVEQEDSLIIEGIEDQDFSKYDQEISKVINNFEVFLKSDYPIEDINDLSNLKKTKFVLDTIYNIGKDTITKEEVIEEGRKYFTSFIPEENNIKLDNNDYYFYQNNVYTKNQNTKESACFMQSNTISKKATNKDWSITKKIYFIKQDLKDEESMTFDLKIFKSLEECLKSKNILYNSDSNTAVLTTDEYKAIEDKLDTVVYNLERNNDNYFLKSIKYTSN